MPAETKEETIVTFHVPPGYTEDARLDVYLTRFLQNATRAKVQRGIKQGMVTVNGEVVAKVSHRVGPGDHVVCRLMRPPPMEITPEAIPLDIVYEDDALIVVNKAAGMVVHPAYGHRTGTLVHALLHHLGSGPFRLDGAEDEPPANGQDDGEEEDVPVHVPLLSTGHLAPRPGSHAVVRPGIVHRLDKDTTGLMVIAKDDAVHTHLARQFERRTIRRHYQALVWGVPSEPIGRIERALGRDPRDRKRMAVVKPGRGKHAVTHYQVEETLAYTALLAFRLETGRTHQIRVHARSIGHPLLGDQTYDGTVIKAGPDTSNRRAFFRNLFNVMPRQALHASSLGFRHPTTGEAVFFASDLPDDMARVLQRLRAVEPASTP